jgi:iron(III) transport system ATP-binding protein
MTIELRNVFQQFGVTSVLRDVSLTIGSGEFFFLLGPSGCGKTTLLRIIAGFQNPDRGEVSMGGTSMNGVPAHRRNVGMVFQNYALWPHLTVAENVAYGLEVRKVSTPERQRRVAEALEMVRMADLGKRLPGELSGGQQQRVALARALVIRPDVLLLDEPLSNLDARLRLELRDEIRRIQEATRITTVYVTHDQHEALSLADRVAVFEAGVLAQLDAPRNLYTRPGNRFVAEFLGEVNWIEGTVSQSNAQGLVVETPMGPLSTAPRPELMPGSRVRAGFRPESVQWGPTANPSWKGMVIRSFYQGDSEEYGLQLSDGSRVKALVSNPQSVLSPGAEVSVSVRPQDVFVVAR